MGMDNRARRALLSLKNMRKLLGVSGNLIERVNRIFSPRDVRRVIEPFDSTFNLETCNLSGQPTLGWLFQARSPSDRPAFAKSFQRRLDTVSL